MLRPQPRTRVKEKRLRDMISKPSFPRGHLPKSFFNYMIISKYFNLKMRAAPKEWLFQGSFYTFGMFAIEHISLQNLLLGTNRLAPTHTPDRPHNEPI